MSDLATACYDAELESVLEHRARLSVQATQRIANFIQTNQYDEIQIINPTTGNLSPNPPKRSGHPEEARDERSRLETAWP